jgi:hypothetical protein
MIQEGCGQRSIQNRQGFTDRTLGYRAQSGGDGTICSTMLGLPEGVSRCGCQADKCSSLEYCLDISQPPKEAGLALAHTHDVDGAALVAPGNVRLQVALWYQWHNFIRRS